MPGLRGSGLSLWAWVGNCSGLDTGGLCTRSHLQVVAMAG